MLIVLTVSGAPHVFTNIHAEYANLLDDGLIITELFKFVGGLPEFEFKYRYGTKAVTDVSK